MKKLQMAAVVIGLLLILLFLLPEFAQLVGIALAIVFKLLIIALIILVTSHAPQPASQRMAGSGSTKR